MLKLVNRIAFAACAAFFFLVFASSATADSVQATPVLSLANKQTWALLIGALVPLGTYAVNHAAPWVSESTKAMVTVLVAAVAGGLYTALSTTTFGWNSATLQMVLTAVVAALGAHQFLWKPSGVSTKLGAGSNAQSFGHFVWVKNTPTKDPPAA